jgi:hypothetical protein
MCRTFAAVQKRTLSMGNFTVFHHMHDLDGEDLQAPPQTEGILTPRCPPNLHRHTIQAFVNIRQCNACKEPEARYQCWYCLPSQMLYNLCTMVLVATRVFESVNGLFRTSIRHSLLAVVYREQFRIQILLAISAILVEADGTGVRFGSQDFEAQLCDSRSLCQPLTKPRRMQVFGF